MPKDKIKSGFPYEQEVAISDSTMTYSQKQDDCSENLEDLQYLKVSTANSGAGTYYVLETERWAINDIDELIKVLKDFKNRIK